MKSAFREVSRPVSASAALVVVLLAVLIALGIPLSQTAGSLGLIWLNLAAFTMLWARIRRTSSLAEGLAMATVGSLVIPALLRLLHAPPIVAWVAAPVIAAGLILVVGRGSQARPSRINASALVGALVALAATLFLLRSQITQYASAISGDLSLLHPNFIELEAISQAAGEFEVAGMGMMSDWPIRYHWLSYAWSGSLGAAAHAPAYLTTAIILPLFSVAALALLTATVVSLLTQRPWAPALGALLAVTAHPLADSAALTVNWASPSHVASLPLLLGVLLIVITSLDGPDDSEPKISWGWAATLVAVLSFTAVGFKFSTGAVIFGTLVVATLLAALLRTGYARHLAVLAASATLAGFASWLLLESGQETTGQLFLRSLGSDRSIGDLIGSWGSAAWTTAVLVPGAAGVLYLLARATTRRDPSTLLGAGLLIVSLAPLWLLEDTRPNSTWFTSAAVAGLAIASATAVASGACAASRRLRGIRLPIVSLATAIVVALAWALCIHYLPWLSWPVFYVAGIGVASGAVTLALTRPSPGLRASTFGVMIMASLVVTPLAIPVAERAVPGGPPTAPPPELLTIPQQLQEIPAYASTAVEGAPTTPVTEWSTPPKRGEIVAYADARLTPTLLRYRARPYVFSVYWASLLGPDGSRKEALTRQDLVADFLSSGSRRALAEMCRDGVTAVAQVDGSGAARIETLDCAGSE